MKKERDGTEALTCAEEHWGESGQRTATKAAARMKIWKAGPGEKKTMRTNSRKCDWMDNSEQRIAGMAAYRKAAIPAMKK
jgi:hypothetical protein